MTQYNADELWEELENSPTQNIDKLSKELSEAKDEIARLTEENAELREFDLTKTDAEWREIYDDQLKRTGFFSGQLTEAKAEIERLEEHGRFWFAEFKKAEAEIARLTDYNARLHADIAEIGKDNDELEAEIARLREWKTAAENLIAAIRLDSGIAYPWPALDLAEAALKPDTGEQLIAELHVSGTKEEWLAALASNREDAALKPDMPRQYSTGELAAAVTLAKANLVGGPELDKQFKAYVEAVEAAIKPDTGEQP